MTPTGSRRMDEVKPRRYSPCERPSRMRAAPAKKRIWLTDGGISSLAVRLAGLPVFSHSTATSSSAWASTKSATLSSAPWRSDGVVQRQPWKASAAARYAASMSAAPDFGLVA